MAQSLAHATPQARYDAPSAREVPLRPQRTRRPAVVGDRVVWLVFMALLAFSTGTMVGTVWRRVPLAFALQQLGVPREAVRPTVAGALDPREIALYAGAGADPDRPVVLPDEIRRRLARHPFVARVEPRAGATVAHVVPRVPRAFVRAAGDPRDRVWLVDGDYRPMYVGTAAEARSAAARAGAATPLPWYDGASLGGAGRPRAELRAFRLDARRMAEAVAAWNNAVGPGGPQAVGGVLDHFRRLRLCVGARPTLIVFADGDAAAAAGRVPAAAAAFAAYQAEFGVAPHAVAVDHTDTPGRSTVRVVGEPDSSSGARPDPCAPPVSLSATGVASDAVER